MTARRARPWLVTEPIPFEILGPTLPYLYMNAKTLHFALDYSEVVELALAEVYVSYAMILRSMCD